MASAPQYADIFRVSRPPPQSAHLFRDSRPHWGCWYPIATEPSRLQHSSLPLQSMRVHTTIKDVTSRTILTQTFSNNTNDLLKDVSYSFPLYDGVSVVSFSITIGDVRIHGVVKEKQQARREYNDAVNHGSSAGLLEQLTASSDILTTKMGNVPAGARVVVEIVYVGELKHDAQVNGTRFTIPTIIAPRYGVAPSDFAAGSALPTTKCDGGIQVTVDFQSPEGYLVRSIQSPSHPISVTVGRTSDMPVDAVYMSNCGSATLSVDSTALDKDFIVIAQIKDSDRPKALMETHTTFPAQRALMATLVPRFNLAPTHGEIVFIVDRSGSMGNRMEMVIQAMIILLKSLPVGVKFNICSFGSHHSFLWPQSKSYDDNSVAEALSHVESFQANFGGTELYEPVTTTLSRRLPDMFLDAIILTDGQIWDQGQLFNLIEGASRDHKCRFFALGIGSGVSTALVEGIAKSGQGFSQFVTAGEKMNAKMVQLLKGALSPRIENYSLEVKYKQDDNDFEMVEKDSSDVEIIESAQVASKIDTTSPTASQTGPATKPEISFFNEEMDTLTISDATMDAAKTKEVEPSPQLPVISPPSVIQAPYQVPPLYPSSRTTVYLMLDPRTSHLTPEAIILRATCPQGPLKLEIEVEDIGKGETIHQLAAKKTISELEMNGGWLNTAKSETDGILLKTKHQSNWDTIVEREAVRLGVRYQISGKFCSFVAVQGDVELEAVLEKSGSESGTRESSLHTPVVVNRKMAQRSHASSRQSILPMQSMQSSPVGRIAVQQFSSISGSSYNSPPTHAVAFGQMAQCSPPPPPLPMASFKAASSGNTSVRSRRLCKKKSPAARAGNSSDEDEDQQPVDEKDEKMQQVILLQKSDGSWIWDQRLRDAMGVTGDANLGEQDAAAATAFAVAFLLACVAGGDDGFCDLIVDKAKGWLAQQQQQAVVDVEKAISDASALLMNSSASYKSICEKSGSGA